MNRPFWPLAQAARLAAAPALGHEPGPGGGTHPIAGCLEEGKWHPPASPRPQPSSPRNRRLHCLVNKRDRAAASAALGPWTWAQKGTPEQGAATWRFAKAASQWAPAHWDTSTSFAVAQAASICFTPDARQALALSTGLVGYGLYLRPA